eukprot:SAG25_NODE_777_length_5391_cov_3.055745_3_plen_144_part_00
MEHFENFVMFLQHFLFVLPNCRADFIFKLVHLLPRVLLQRARDRSHALVVRQASKRRAVVRINSNTRALTVLSKAEEAASMLSPCPRGLSICSQHGKSSRVLSSLGMTDMTSRISSALQEDFTSHVCFYSEDAKSKVDARTFL